MQVNSFLLASFSISPSSCALPQKKPPRPDLLYWVPTASLKCPTVRRLLASSEIWPRVHLWIFRTHTDNTHPCTHPCDRQSFLSPSVVVTWHIPGQLTLSKSLKTSIPRCPYWTVGRWMDISYCSDKKRARQTKALSHKVSTPKWHTSFSDDPVVCLGFPSLWNPLLVACE